MKKIHKRHVRRTILILLGILVVIVLFSFIIIQLNKGNIRNAVTQLLSDRFHSVVSVGSLNISMLQNFPHLSVEFSDVSIKDSATASNGILPPDFTCENFSCSVALFPLLTKKVQIKALILKGAKINIIKTKAGASNFIPLQQNKSSATSPSSSSASTFKNGKILLQDVQFLFSDSTKNKSIAFVIHKLQATITSPDSVSHFICSGSVTCNGLGFNLNQGSYLTQQSMLLNAKLDWIPSEQKLSITSASLQFAPNDVNLNGSFIFGPNGRFYLHISDQQITLPEVRQLLTTHIASKLKSYHFSDEMHAEAIIQGSLAGGRQPQVDVVFTSDRNGNFTVRKSFFTDAYVHGVYTNHVDPTKEPSDENSTLIVPFFSGQFAGQLPMTAKLRVNDFSNPYALLDGSSDVSLDSFNDLLDTAHFQFVDGDLRTRFRVFCPINQFIDTSNHILHAEISGVIALKDGNVWMPLNEYHFENMEGSLFFDASDVRGDSLHILWNGIPIVVNLNVSGIIPAIFIAGTKTHATADVWCNTFDVKKIILPETPTQKKLKKELNRKEVAQKAAKDSLPSTAAAAAYWDQLIYNMIVDMNLQAHRVEYKNFRASNLNAHAQFQPEGIQLQNALLQTAGGTLQMQVFISDPTKKKHHISLDCNLYKVQIDDLLHYCDNFNQDVITQKNIRGTLSANLKWQADFKEDYEVIPPSMHGRMIWSLENGQLIGLDALQAASKYFPSRDFTNISFAKMQDTVLMQGQNFTFTKMKVLSSVLSFYTSGVYSFEGNTNLKVQIPLSNLKKPDTELSDSLKEKPETTINFHLVNKDGKNVLLFDGISFHKKMMKPK